MNNGVIDRMEINEACSSGCGSFLETFAKSLGYSAQEFSLAACHSEAPCDLGTRCTVFLKYKSETGTQGGGNGSMILPPDWHIPLSRIACIRC